MAPVAGSKTVRGDRPASGIPRRRLDADVELSRLSLSRISLRSEASSAAGALAGGRRLSLSSPAGMRAPASPSATLGAWPETETDDAWEEATLPYAAAEEQAETNAAGVPMRLGARSSTYYCRRRLGVELIPGSDGRCGPDGGPQCDDCRLAQQQVLKDCREEARSLRAELGEAEAAARDHGRMCRRLEGEVKSRVQWMLTWERQAAAAPIVPGGAPGSGASGVPWLAWKAFLERSSAEARKTTALLGRRPDLERARAELSDLQDAVHQVDGQLEALDFPDGAASELLRRQPSRQSLRGYGFEGSAGGLGGQGGRAVGLLRTELALREREHRELREELARQEGERARLEAELSEASSCLGELSKGQRLQRLQRACEQKQALEQQIREVGRRQVLREEEASKRQREEVARHDETVRETNEGIRVLKAEAERLKAATLAAKGVADRDLQAAAWRRWHTVAMARAAKEDAAKLRRRWEGAGAGRPAAE